MVSGGLLGFVRMFTVLVATFLLGLSPFDSTSSAEDVGDGLDISFQPENLELAYHEKGTFNITVTNSNDLVMYVRIVHFRTKCTEGSTTWIEPDFLEVPPGGTNASLVTVRSNSRGLESPRASDLRLGFNWSTVADEDFLAEHWYDTKWEYDYDIVDLTDASDDAYLSSLVWIAVAIVIIMPIMMYIVWRRPGGK